MSNKQPDAIMQRMRKGRWMTALLCRDGSVHDIRFWPTKTAANAWLCIRLHKLAVIQDVTHNSGIRRQFTKERRNDR